MGLGRSGKLLRSCRRASGNALGFACTSQRNGGRREPRLHSEGPSGGAEVCRQAFAVTKNFGLTILRIGQQDDWKRFPQVGVEDMHF